MIVVPVIVLLFIFGAFLLFWLIFSFVAMYHVLAFGFKNFATFFAAFAYIIVSVMMLLTSYNYLKDVDWTVQLFSIDKNLFSSNLNFISNNSEESLEN